MIDLRSDTVTKPTRGMREAVANAEVGDDVYGEDPTTCALEEEVAQLLGKEAALFTVSGSMANQLAIGVHTRPGDGVVAAKTTHPVWNEAGAAAVLSGVQFLVVGDDGLVRPDDVDWNVNPGVYGYPKASLVCLENTLNRAGGLVYPQSLVRDVAERVRRHGIALHLDGARLWNASVASGLSVAELAAPSDTVSVCFSKGLGAPVGSALAGPAALIRETRRLRQRWGGAMRQSGILAAAARYALAHHRARLVEDHAHARLLAERLSGAPGIHVDAAKVETNIVNIDLDAPAADVAAAAGKLGLRIGASTPRRLRAITHLDVTSAQIEEAAAILRQIMSTTMGSHP